MCNPDIEAYLRTTPLVQWQREKMMLSLDEVISAAKAKGLRFGTPEAVNTEDYAVYASNGELLRRGNLASMRFFIERY